MKKKLNYKLPETETSLMNFSDLDIVGLQKDFRRQDIHVMRGSISV